MDKKDNPIPNIDSTTGLVKEEYRDYQFPKKVKWNKKLDYFKPIDIRTDFERGIYYLTCDGQEVATMEEVIEYNNIFYENMKVDKTDTFSEESGMRR